jgi:hypothetical protein
VTTLNKLSGNQNLLLQYIRRYLKNVSELLKIILTMKEVIPMYLGQFFLPELGNEPWTLIFVFIYFLSPYHWATAPHQLRYLNCNFAINNFCQY